MCLPPTLIVKAGATHKEFTNNSLSVAKHLYQRYNKSNTKGKGDSTMNKLTEKQTEDLFLLKAIEDYSQSEERFDSLNDVLEELFANGAIDRDELFYSIMVFTNSGLVTSNIECEEDIELTEAVGFDIEGFTEQGKQYIEDLLKQQQMKEKAKGILKSIDSTLGKLADTNIYKFISGLI